MTKEEYTLEFSPIGLAVQEKKDDKRMNVQKDRLTHKLIDRHAISLNLKEEIETIL